jgi:hypothetical protein
MYCAWPVTFSLKSIRGCEFGQLPVPDTRFSFLAAMRNSVISVDNLFRVQLSLFPRASDIL